MRELSYSRIYQHSRAYITGCALSAAALGIAAMSLWIAHRNATAAAAGLLLLIASGITLGARMNEISCDW